MAATYIKMPGIPGTSEKPGRAAWIEILSFDDGYYTPKIEQRSPDPPPRRDPTGGGVLKVRKELDAASKKLHEAQQSNQRFDAVDIEVTQFDAASGKEVVQTTRTYVEAIVVEVKLTTASPRDSIGGREYEEITLTYSRRQGTGKDPNDSDSAKKPAQALPGGTLDHAFLQVPGIPGDVKETPHTAWIGLLQVNQLASGRAGTVRPIEAGPNWPSSIEPIPASDDGTLTVTKRQDSATPKLRAAFDAQTHFEQIVVDIPRTSGTQRLTLKNALIIRVQKGANPARPPVQGPQPIVEEVTFSYDRVARDVVPPAKKPAAHPVTRANMAAVAEHSTINLRPPKFFELALPVLNGENGRRIYPPATATVRLTSQRGYDRSYSVSAGMITDDDFCSFRFYDISEKATDELFTATLESGGETETIFKDRPVATYIRAARKSGKYETTFSSSPPAQPTAQTPDGLLVPVADSAGA